MFLGRIEPRTRLPEIYGAGTQAEELRVFDGPSGGDFGDDNELASGGSGNDTIVGTPYGDALFGGPGHDILLGYDSNDNAATSYNRLYGDDGDDILFH